MRHDDVFLFPYKVNVVITVSKECAFGENIKIICVSSLHFTSLSLECNKMALKYFPLKFINLFNETKEMP